VVPLSKRFVNSIIILSKVLKTSFRYDTCDVNEILKKRVVEERVVEERVVLERVGISTLLHSPQLLSPCFNTY
jgi:hypothetical protein